MRKVFENEVNSGEVELFLQDFQHSDDFEDQFKKKTESESDPSLWTTSNFFLKKKSSSEDEELAGPSHTDTPKLQGKLYFYLECRKQWYIREKQRSSEEPFLSFFTKAPSEVKRGPHTGERANPLERMIGKPKTGASHFVKHLQFTKWPDDGTPASAEGFIKYVRYVRKSHLTGPIIVHCSAGVGRTGVFLCVDVVFCAIEKNFSFNIMNIVGQMREQRYGFH
ncbi:LOW QUALITY PROTEIN: tyrosine-protein phosphatase non-receptor type 20 [Mesoplodon densirostris]|uniref:LOW QUALITY PROTEIN: tyrosine-protein phosphatase non-receptor type 20 n=1 Tax=Mesoplodon densirostris TaxID=48708 RepID=UPI0028DBFC59|nr:LOW QUALITY PROTEIN: tyrosine-protein phosphatase non-receptor type 20 [Mesoplodon densirostris]